MKWNLIIFIWWSHRNIDEKHSTLLDKICKKKMSIDFDFVVKYVFLNYPQVNCGVSGLRIDPSVSSRGCRKSRLRDYPDLLIRFVGIRFVLAGSLLWNVLLLEESVSRVSRGKQWRRWAHHLSRLYSTMVQPTVKRGLLWLCLPLRGKRRVSMYVCNVSRYRKRTNFVDEFILSGT